MGEFAPSVANGGGKATIAQELARRHYLADVGLRTVYRLVADDENEERPAEPIKLLEVNDDAVPAGVLPVSLGPA